MGTIPKIIHQTWRNAELPTPFNLLADSWKEQHPTWQYILWTDEMNRNYINTNFPTFIHRYDSYPTNIQRVDAFRYFLLRKMGGLYIDIDIECLINIDELVSDKSCVIGKEPFQHCERFSKEMILCNAFIGSSPDNPFMEFVCKRIEEYHPIEVSNPIDVLNSTGPFMLTNSYLDYDKKKDIKLLDSKTIYPLTMFETKRLLMTRSITSEMEKKLNMAHAIHYFWGSW